jgi:opine dehydrogenase
MKFHAIERAVQMDIAVLGGGNGSFAAAADLSEAGHSIRFWRRESAAHDALRAAGGKLTIKDHAGQRDVVVAMVTADLGQAVQGADLIVCPTPAMAQPDIALGLAPHLGDGQVVFLPPGSFGSWIMAELAQKAGCRADVAWAETGTLPYLTRKHGAQIVAITTRASRLPTGVYPERLADHALSVIGRTYPAIEPCGDALSGALMNAGPIIHPPLILMNAGPIEHFEHWDIHNEGTQPAIRRVTTALDAERMAVREALGYGAPHFPLADHYETSNWMYGNLAHDKLVDSGDWREHLELSDHRYMREDVEIGLAFLVSVADWVDVPAPVAKGLLALGSAVCGVDFRQGKRTLEGLGLAKHDPAALQRLLRDGAP